MIRYREFPDIPMRPKRAYALYTLNIYVYNYTVNYP